MAKVVKSQQQVIAEPWWVKIKIVYIGAGLGIVWWIITAILQHYVVEPLACRDLSSATACVDSFGVAGSVAAILVAVLSIYILVKTVQPRPIIIAIAAAVLLWSLGFVLRGLQLWETLLWALFIYAAAYSLFSLVARIRSTVVSVVVAAIVVIAIRLILML